MRSPEALFQNVEYHDRENLRSWHLPIELRKHVQIGVIEALDDLSVHTIVDIHEIANHPRGGIHLTADSDFYGVVMSVSMRIVALAIRGPIVGFAQTIAMQTMRRR